MIDPHFWESADIKKLDVFARYIFMSMFSHADDEGRNIGSAVYIRNITFPLEDVSLSKVKAALAEIEKYLYVEFYTVDGEEYYQLTKWCDWQKVDHPTKSLFPELNRESLANESRITREPLCPNIKEDKVKESKVKEDNAPAVADFDLFWKSYPKKTAKQAAQKAWGKLKPDDVLLTVMLSVLESKKKSVEWTKDGGQFIPYPATWINGRRWEDEGVQKDKPKYTFGGQ